MPLGKESVLRLATSHAELERLIFAVSKGVDAGDLAWADIHDITVLCGYRGKEEQNQAVANGASKTPWPKSHHNRVPSDAVDVAVYPVEYKDPAYEVKMRVLHAYVTGIARASSIKLRHIDWDMPHIQRDVP